ncbi:hypothetical protein BKA67DRAFT_588234 [Truncatella angustata]|uniref:Uncharacterized protein n=1 Tax=Truncatella angustata TaxID=152316 RepID=A0A9P8RHR4_9PEZI|nr:uncharacterized protein BKA67DRAFT_588234 [Truncatella angustata]KAH6640003.1 hypothetical protein BKA67DRAFT_588234 [Truncatella angustata]
MFRLHQSRPLQTTLAFWFNGFFLYRFLVSFCPLFTWACCSMYLYRLYLTFQEGGRGSVGITLLPVSCFPIVGGKLVATNSGGPEYCIQINVYTCHCPRMVVAAPADVQLITSNQAAGLLHKRFRKAKRFWGPLHTQGVMGIWF